MNLLDYIFILLILIVLARIIMRRLSQANDRAEHKAPTRGREYARRIARALD